MFLKRLELHGFKTFAEKKEIEFIPGLTAVVGPNGSGKSNLTDAVRYVLGEQSIRNLRASKLEELIFVGSPEKGVAKRCQVSAVFDNSDHQLAIDFNEVALSRTTSREGESRYSINGVDCRLRDMQELLMGSGIGPGSFYILGAREIDMVLSNDPKERRHMLEETAGTNLYKFRRKEALRKLEQAQQNLRRLKDVKIELEGQLSESQKALHRYERYRQAQVELQELEAHLAWIKYSRAQEEFRRSQDELHKIKDQSTWADQQLAKLQNELEICQNEQRERLQERVKLQEEISDRRENISFALASQDGLNRRVVQLEDDIKLAKVRAENLQKRVSERKERLTCLEEEIARGRASLALSQELFQNWHNLRAELESNRKEEESLSLQREAEKQRISLGDLRLQNLKGQWDILQGERAEERDLSEDLATLNNIYLQVKADRERAEDNFKSKQTKLRDLRQRRTNLERSRRSLNSQVAEAESILEERSGVPLPVRTVLKWNLPGTIGTVGELIKVPHGLEVALEVALGGRVNDVIVRDRQVASELVERLKRDRIGRVTFWPLDLQRREVEPMILPTRQGVVGFCLDLIDFSAELCPVLSQIFGQIAVMESLKDALTLFDLCKGRRPHLVTLQGEYLSAVGSVTGGSLKTDRTGLFTKKHFYEDLSSQLDDLEREIAEIVKSEEEENLLLHEAEKTWQNYRESERTAKERLADAEAENKRLLRQQKLLQSNTDNLQKDILSLEKEILQSQEKLAEIEEKLPLLLQRRKSIEEQLAPLREAETSKENLTRQLSINEYERDNINRQLAESWEDLQQVQGDLKRLELSREESLSEGGKIDTSISSRRAELNQLNQKLSDLNLFLEENNLRLTSLKLQQSQNAFEARTLGEKLSSAQTNLSSLQNILDIEERNWQNFNTAEDKLKNWNEDFDTDKAQKQKE
ncbi:AAA family ATPase, partial [bacterium]|nr:AAA family ATPase [bacterium]